MAIAKVDALKIWDRFFSLNGNKHLKKTKQMCYDYLDEKIQKETNPYERRHLRSVKQEIEKL